LKIWGTMREPQFPIGGAQGRKSSSPRTLGETHGPETWATKEKDVIPKDKRKVTQDCNLKKKRKKKILQAESSKKSGQPAFSLPKKLRKRGRLKGRPSPRRWKRDG